MKKLLFIIVSMTSPLFSYSFLNPDYVEMIKYDAHSIDFTWTKCYYKSLFGGKFRISIIIKGSTYSCPYSIKYYPESGTWSE